MIAPPKTLAIVGTDTGIGKTTIARGVISLLARHHRVAPFKPAETGCQQRADGLFPSDAHLLIKAAGSPLDENLVIPYTFVLPASPLAAAYHADTTVDRSHLLRCYEQLASSHDRVVIEGAGGLLVPYADQWTFADLLQDIRPTVLLVARASLGTINHTLLTIAELHRRNLPIAGIILNRLSETPGPEEASTPSTIESFASVPVLGIMPYLSPAFDTTNITQALTQSIDISALL